MITISTAVKKAFFTALAARKAVIKHAQRLRPLSLSKFLSGIGLIIVFIFTLNLFIPAHSAWGFVFGQQNFSESNIPTITVNINYGISSRFLAATALQASSGPEIQGGPDEDFDLTTFEGDTLVPYSGPLTTFTSNNIREGIITYTVQSGDSASTIAASFGLTVNTVLWANKLTEWSLLKPGQELIISPVSGVIHKIVSGDTIAAIAKKYKANSDEIIAFNHLDSDSGLVVGETLVIPDGEMPQAPRPAAKPVYYAPALPSIDGYYIFPTLGGRNQGRLHPTNATDIGNSCGSPVYAAAEGSVIIADGVGWNGGYGKYVKINHPNGTATLYSHASKLLIEAGQQVAQGQVIALVGSTGRSTGCHVHFEVRGAKNPFVRY